MADNIAASSASSATKSFFGGITGTLGVIVGLVVALCICCSGIIFLSGWGQSLSTSDDPTKVGTNGSSTGSSNATAVPAQTFKVGDVIKLGDLSFVVNAFDENASSSNQYDKPASGNKYVAVDVKITNNGSSTYGITSYSFKMKDAGDYSYDSTYSTTRTPELNSETLAKGASARGWVTFEVQNGAKGLKIIFTPNMFDNNQAIVQLN